MAVGFPMQTADGEIIFPVGNTFTLTANQILELLERGELDAEGVRRTIGQRLFIESIFYLKHGVRTRLNCVMHLPRRTLSHRSQSRLDGFVSLTVVHHFP